MVDDYRWESGSPSFLPQWLKTHRPNFDLSKQLERVTGGSLLIDNSDNVNPAALVFQTGYLAVVRVDKTALRIVRMNTARRGAASTIPIWS